MKLEVTPWVSRDDGSDYVLYCKVTIDIEGRTYSKIAIAKSEADGWDEKAKRHTICRKAREIMIDALYEQYPELFQ